MKYMTTAALVLNLGAASIYAQQRPATGSFSGSASPSTVVLQQGLNTSGYEFEGNGTLGPFTLRAFTASASAQKPIGSACSIYASVVAGAGVLRSQDGSLLMVNSAQGTDCIQFLATGPIAFCTRTFKVARGTGRFKGAAGDTVTFSFTVLPVLFDASGSPVLSGITDGELTGMLSSN